MASLSCFLVVVVVVVGVDKLRAELGMGESGAAIVQ